MQNFVFTMVHVHMVNARSFASGWLRVLGNVCNLHHDANTIAPTQALESKNICVDRYSYLIHKSCSPNNVASKLRENYFLGPLESWI